MFPVRVVLNNATITVFGSEDPDSIYRAYELSYLVLKKKANDD